MMEIQKDEFFMKNSELSAEFSKYVMEHPEIDDDYIIDSMENHREWYGGFYTVIQHIAKKRDIRG